MNNTKIGDFYKDKVVLVTGGAGSIGSELVRTLLKLDPRAVRVFDSSEGGLFTLEQSLKSKRIRTLVGDIRDKERLSRAFEDVDYVFHAAALKHVPLTEYNPFEAIKTNVIGTQNVIDVSLDNEVKKMILVSTDKAVNPNNVLGATKLLAERLTISANHYKGKRKTAFSCVRFGNVLNSSGSVAPIFKEQIVKGGPVTVTDKGMTRFIMSIPMAAELIIKATIIAEGKEVFILKMPALNIVDLAEVMIEELTPRYGLDPRSIGIDFIGKRPGEKMFEELMTEEEAEYEIEHDGFYILNSQNGHVNKEKVKRYTSNDVEKLGKDEIRMILRECGVLQTF